MSDSLFSFESWRKKWKPREAPNQELLVEYALHDCWDASRAFTIGELRKKFHEAGLHGHYNLIQSLFPEDL